MVYVDEITVLSSETTEKQSRYFYYRDEKDYGYSLPEVKDNELVITQSWVIEEYYKARGIPYKRLSQYLGFKDTYGLYELYSMLFEGKIGTDFDMIRLLLQGYSSPKRCFCLKLGATVCIFDVSTDGVVKKIASLQFSEKQSKYTVGRFIKRLRYSIADSGYNILGTSYLCWTARDYYCFEDYVSSPIELKEMFSHIGSLSTMSLRALIKFLGKGKVTEASADSFVSCLRVSGRELGLHKNIMGNLEVNNDFSRDYVSVSVDMPYSSYFLVLDTEGVKSSTGRMTNGVSEVGGLICGYSDGIIGVVSSFYSDRVLLKETLNAVVKNPVFRGKIPTIVLGGSDEVMLRHSGVEKLLARLKFIDATSYVHSIYDGTLSNMAKSYGVQVYYPKHSALNDSKTLFNVLAEVLRRTGKWIL